MISKPIEIDWRGQPVVVRRNDKHPEEHLWIDIEGKTFFLGILTPGMTRREVRALAEKWLREKGR